MKNNNQNSAKVYELKNIEELDEYINDFESTMKLQLLESLKELSFVAGPLLISAGGYLIFKTPYSFVIGACEGIVEYIIRYAYNDIKATIDSAGTHNYDAITDDIYKVKYYPEENSQIKIRKK